MVDAEGLNPSVALATCGFESHPGHDGWPTASGVLGRLVLQGQEGFGHLGEVRVPVVWFGQGNHDEL